MHSACPSILAAGLVAIAVTFCGAILGGAFEVEELFAAKVAALRGGLHE